MSSMRSSFTVLLRSGPQVEPVRIEGDADCAPRRAYGPTSRSTFRVVVRAFAVRYIRGVGRPCLGPVVAWLS